MKVKPADYKPAAEMVTKAVAAIVLDDPFYGYLLLRQEMVPTDTVPTAATNGVNLFYNPAFVRKQTLNQLKGLLKHEVMHVAHLHHLRRDNRDPQRWNIAADLVINAHLKKAGVELPEGGLVDETFEQYSTEHAYNLLPEGVDGSGRVPGQGPDNGGFPPPWDFGGVMDHPEGGPSASESVKQQLEDDAKLDVIQAANTAKIMGKEPAGLDRLIEAVRESKMPWRKILARFFRSTAKDNESWMRPNRRFVAHDIYLPSLHSEALGPLVIGIDTSGSIAQQELSDFFACVNSILKHTKPEAIHLVYCDAAVANVQKLTTRDLPLRPDKFEPKGGGGTSFVPVFDYVRENKLRPVALLYLTDMYGSFPDKAPSYPTIWCATSKEKAPFGKTLELK